MRNTSNRQRNTWASYVAATRTLLSLTKAEMARRIQVDRITIARWETGETKPGEPNIIARFAEAFELDLDEALAAAGLRPGVVGVRKPSREAPMPKELLVVLRMLADTTGKYTEADKDYIRRSLVELARTEPTSTAAEPLRQTGS